MAKQTKVETKKSRSGKSGWSAWKARSTASLDTEKEVSSEAVSITHVEKHDKACQTEPPPTEPDSPKWRVVSQVPRQLATIQQTIYENCFH